MASLHLAMITYEHIIKLAKDKEDYNPKDWDAYHFLVYGKSALADIKTEPQKKTFIIKLKKSLTNSFLRNILKNYKWRF